MNDTKDRLEDVVKERKRVGDLADKKRKERDDVREQRNRKRERDPRLESRERELKREIEELNREEDRLTKRIKDLDKREERLEKKEDKLEEKLKRQRPDFNGHPDNVNADVRYLVRVANSFGLYITSTTDGTGHTYYSWHYPRNNPDNLGGALDAGAQSQDPMVRFQRWCAERAHKFREVIGPENSSCVSNGVRYTIGEGGATEQAHDNHDHVAPYPGAFS